MIVEGEKAAPLLPCRLGEAELRDPVGALARMEGNGRFRLLPYQAVGVECGLLLAVRLDGAAMEGREQGPVLVALSPNPVSDGGGYRILIGATEGR